MLRKIDCVMIRVDDPEAASQFYAEVLGMIPLWSDDDSVGLGFPETDAEIVLHRKPEIPHTVEVHYLVDDVVTATPILEHQGCRVMERPFDTPIGKCAVISDPFGTVLCILDMTKGPRRSN